MLVQPSFGYNSLPFVIEVFARPTVPSWMNSPRHAPPTTSLTTISHLSMSLPLKNSYSHSLLRPEEGAMMDPEVAAEVALCSIISSITNPHLQSSYLQISLPILPPLGPPMAPQAPLKHLLPNLIRLRNHPRPSAATAQQPAAPRNPNSPKKSSAPVWQPPSSTMPSEKRRID